MKADKLINKRYARNPMVVARKVAGEFLLVPIQSRASALDSIYTLDEVGSRIWELLEGELTQGEICDVLTEEFDVTREQASTDLASFVERIRALDLVLER